MTLQRAIGTTFTTLSSIAPRSATCDDVHHCRTVPSIIYSCLSTMFLCTWVALHLDVPKDPWEPGWKRLLRRVGWMFLALIAPEAILFKAFKDWTICSGWLKELVKGEGRGYNWTETHALMVHMGGVQRGSTVGSSSKEQLKLDSIPEHVRLPKKEEILEKGQGDNVAKMFAVIQTLWFAIQCADRISQGLVVTELELTTLGHVVLNIFIYWCWWNKPLNPRFPVDISLESHAPERVQVGRNLEPVNTELQDPRSLPLRVRMGAYLHENVPMDGKVVGGLVILDSGTNASAIAVIPLVSIIGGIFGAVHCLAWNSAFPTHIEHILWRCSAAVVTAVPGLSTTTMVVGMIIFECNIPIITLPTNYVFTGILYLSPYVYCIARLCLLILALTTLRDLPYKAFETPSWAAYIPHIG